jgi:hypothetical protein
MKVLSLVLQESTHASTSIFVTQIIFYHSPLDSASEELLVAVPILSVDTEVQKSLVSL